MSNFDEEMAKMWKGNSKVLEGLAERYIMRPSFLPDQDMKLEDVAYREGQKALIQSFIDISRGH